MTLISPFLIIGIIMTLVSIVFVGIASGRKVKSSADFVTGSGKANLGIVFGAYSGVLVGGSATIGTAQLAFSYGFSAWWFTLGGGISCLFLAFVFLKPFRRSGCDTIQQMISLEYGKAAGTITSIFSSLGLMLNVVVQVLAANALFTSIFPIGREFSALIVVIIMFCYVVLGGIMGTGILGIMKTVLIWCGVAVSTVLAYKMGGGFHGFRAVLPPNQYFNLVARGMGVDLGAGLSLILGVASTQSYVQIINSGKTDAISRNGLILAGISAPPIGLGCVIIGMYMRITYPSIDSGQALPLFVLQQLPPFFAGVIIAALLIALIGTGSSNAFGLSTILTNNIYKEFVNPRADDKKTLMISRLMIVFIIVLSAFFALLNTGSIILEWGFLSSALRAAVLFIPMCAALFVKSRTDRLSVISSSIMALIAVLIGHFIPWLTIDPLFIGIFVGALCILAGMFMKSRSIQQGNDPARSTKTL